MAGRESGACARRIEVAVVAVMAMAMVLVVGCSSGADVDSAALDRCEAKWGVGNCVERSGSWVPLASATTTTSTSSTTTSSMPPTTAATTPPAPVTTTAAPSATTAPQAATQPTHEISRPAAGGWVTMFASIPIDSPGEVDETIDAWLAKGFGVELLDSRDYAGLGDPYWVLAGTGFASEQEAAEQCSFVLGEPPFAFLTDCIPRQL